MESRNMLIGAVVLGFAAGGWLIFRPESTLRDEASVGSVATGQTKIAPVREYKTVNFEITTNRTEDIAGGVAVAVNRTDPDSQRFSGRVLLKPEKREFPVNGQSANSPVVFYSWDKNKRYELVIETVKENSVIGHLIIPAG